MRYRLRTLFLAIAVFAFDAACLSPAADQYWLPVPILVLATVAFPAACVVGLVHGKPSQRAFCMAALVPMGITALAVVFHAVNFGRYIQDPKDWWSAPLHEFSSFQAYLVLMLVIGNLTGFVGVVTSWMLMKYNSTTERTEQNQRH